MGCCASSTAEEIDPESDAPRSVRKAAKEKILTTEPSHIELDESTCQLEGVGKYRYEQDDELLAGAEEAAEARRQAAEQQAAAEAEAAAEREQAAAARQREAEERAAKEAEEQARQEAEEQARREAEEKARREAEVAEQARLANLTAAIGGTVARKKAVAPSRVEQLSQVAAMSLDEKAALSAFTRYEDSVQQAAAQLLARLPALARMARKQNKGAPAKGDPANLASLLSMEEHTRNAQFMSVMHAGAASQEHMTPVQVSALRSYIKHCSTMLDKLMSRIPLMPPDVAPTASSYLSTVSQHRDLARAALPA